MLIYTTVYDTMNCICLEGVWVWLCECLSSSKFYYACIAAHEYVHKYQESSMHTDRHVLLKY